MRELTKQEIEMVSGGLDMETGALAILTLSTATPVTFAFGAPIAAAMLYTSYKLSEE